MATAGWTSWPLAGELRPGGLWTGVRSSPLMTGEAQLVCEFLAHSCLFLCGQLFNSLPVFNKVCFCLLSVDLQDLYIFWTRGLRQIHPLMACSCVSSVSCDVFVQCASFLQRRCRCRAAGQGRSGLSRVYKVPTSPSLSCGSFTDAFIHVHADTRIPLNGRQCVRRCATVPTIDLGTSSSPPPPKKRCTFYPSGLHL